MPATLKDIAKETGLSTATISKYLNGAKLREKNRIAIEQAIRKLDYTVNGPRWKSPSAPRRRRTLSARPAPPRRRPSSAPGRY